MPSLIFVAAHPDDDMFGAGPSVALHAQDPQFRFFMIHATDGKAGEIAADSAVTRDELGTVRPRDAERMGSYRSTPGPP